MRRANGGNAITNNLFELFLDILTDDKYYMVETSFNRIMDVLVVLNDGRLIDLEMQMTNEYNWPDRSISYASRNFDQLKRGEYYIDAKPVHSIGFLNFTLFEDNPEFNALYQLNSDAGIIPFFHVSISFA